MAIVDDIKRDSRTKNVLAQTNTKTVSAPPASTGLTGDSLTSEIFTVEDFETVKNQVHIEEANFQLLEALNIIGQITNQQSQSGPIPGTQKIHQSDSVTDSTRTVAFTPEPGHVWSIMNITCQFTNITGSGGLTLYIYDTKNSILQSFFYGSSTSTDFLLDDDGTWDDFTISYPCQLQFVVGSPSNWDSCLLQMNMVRVR